VERQGVAQYSADTLFMKRPRKLSQRMAQARERFAADARLVQAQAWERKDKARAQRVVRSFKRHAVKGTIYL